MTDQVWGYKDGVNKFLEESAAGGAVTVGSGSPVGSVTPAEKGAQYLDQDTGTLYVAAGTTSADWVSIGGSSSAFTNWCVVEVDNGTPVTVTAGSPEYDCVAGDFRIFNQAGSDFSIGDSLLAPGTGALFSAAGGKFEVAVRITVPSNITLDGGSTAARYFLVGLVGGNPHSFPTGDGIDTLLPLDPSISSDPTIQQRMGPMQVEPGGEVFTTLQLAMLNGTGTDQVQGAQSAVVEIYVWNL